MELGRINKMAIKQSTTRYMRIDNQEALVHILLCDFCGHEFEKSHYDPGEVASKARKCGWKIEYKRTDLPGKWRCPNC